MAQVVNIATETLDRLLVTTDDPEILDSLDNTQIASQIAAMSSLINVSNAANDLGFETLNTAENTEKTLNAFEVMLGSMSNKSQINTIEAVPIDDSTAQNVVNSIDSLQLFLYIFLQKKIKIQNKKLLKKKEHCEMSHQKRPSKQ